eukprot:gene7234-7999_t
MFKHNTWLAHVMLMAWARQKMILKRSDKGHAESQCSLGLCLVNGLGVVVDNTEAAAWFHKAAVQGHALAQQHLGLCYFTGRGVSQNYNTAVLWYLQAAKQGQMMAQTSLGGCYARS